MASAAEIPHFNVHDTKWTALPEFGGAEAILYRSPDGSRLAGSFKETGAHHMDMPFDEFIYIVAGSVRISVDDLGTVELGPGDVCYLKQGQSVDFEMSDDFHDVTVLISDHEIDY